MFSVRRFSASFVEQRIRLPLNLSNNYQLALMHLIPTTLACHFY